MVSERVFFVYSSLRPSCLRAYVRRQIQYRINWAALGLSLRRICMLINSKAWGPQAVWNVIKYAINDREIERPSIKDKRPHFLFEHRLLLLSYHVKQEVTGYLHVIILCSQKNLCIKSVSKLCYLKLEIILHKTSFFWDGYRMFVTFKSRACY